MITVVITLQTLKLLSVVQGWGFQGAIDLEDKNLQPCLLNGLALTQDLASSCLGFN